MQAKVSKSPSKVKVTCGWWSRSLIVWLVAEKILIINLQSYKDVYCYNPEYSADMFCVFWCVKSVQVRPFQTPVQAFLSCLRCCFLSFVCYFRPKKCHHQGGQYLPVTEVNAIGFILPMLTRFAFVVVLVSPFRIFLAIFLLFDLCLSRLQAWYALWCLFAV